jgi:hypothetical protein
MSEPSLLEKLAVIPEGIAWLESLTNHEAALLLASEDFMGAGNAEIPKSSARCPTCGRCCSCDAH